MQYETDDVQFKSFSGGVFCCCCGFPRVEQVLHSVCLPEGVVLRKEQYYVEEEITKHIVYHISFETP